MVDSIRSVNNYTTAHAEKPTTRRPDAGSTISISAISEDDIPDLQTSSIRLVLFALLACTGASFFGYTSGMIGGVVELPSFNSSFNLPPHADSQYAFITSNILSFIYFGTIFGSLAIMPISSRYGPLVALAISGGFYTVGSAIQTFCNGSISLMYVGRVLGGLGIGGSCSVAPMYVAEISPAAQRGFLVGLHEISFQITAIFGFWINFGMQRNVADEDRAQWMVPMGLQLFLGATLLLGSVCVLPQSPRFLVRKREIEKARTTLAHIRSLPQDHKVVSIEMTEIETDLAAAGETGLWEGIKLIMGSRAMRYRLAIGSAMMLMLNLTGTVVLLAYTPSIFRSLGFTGRDLPFLLTGCYGIAKGLMSVVSSVWFVDRFGRKNLLIWGYAGMAACLG